MHTAIAVVCEPAQTVKDCRRSTSDVHCLGTLLIKCGRNSLPALPHMTFMSHRVLCGFSVWVDPVDVLLLVPYHDVSLHA